MKEELLLLEYKKRCPRCGEYGGKDGCGFLKRNSREINLQSWCVVCTKEATKKYNQSEKGRQANKRYSQSEKRIQANKQHQKQYQKQVSFLLSDAYIKHLIKTLRKYYGTQAKDITPEDILIKREEIQTKRILKRIRKEMTV